MLNSIPLSISDIRYPTLVLCALQQWLEWPALFGVLSLHTMHTAYVRFNGPDDDDDDVQPAVAEMLCIIRAFLRPGFRVECGMYCPKFRYIIESNLRDIVSKRSAYRKINSGICMSCRPRFVLRPMISLYLFVLVLNEKFRQTEHGNRIDLGFRIYVDWNHL